MILADRARLMAEENMRRRRYNFTHCAMPEIMKKIEKKVVSVSESGNSGTSLSWDPKDIWEAEEKYDCIWDGDGWNEIAEELDKHGYSASSSYVTYNGGVRINLNWKERRP